MLVETKFPPVGPGNDKPANWNQPEELLQDLVHDIRQPLSDIEMIAYHLQTSSSVDPAQMHEMLGKIRRLVEQANEILAGSLRPPISDLPTPQSGASAR